jgi:hypothetical protein
VSGDRAGQPQLRLMLTDVAQKLVREALPDEPVGDRRGFTWSDTLACCRAIPLAGLASRLNRPRLPHAIAHLQYQVTNSSLSASRVTVHLQPLSIAGVGCSRTCSALMWKVVPDAVDA